MITTVTRLLPNWALQWSAMTSSRNRRLAGLAVAQPTPCCSKSTRSARQRAFDAVRLCYQHGWVSCLRRRGEGASIADYCVGLGRHLRKALGAVGNRFPDRSRVGQSSGVLGRKGFKPQVDWEIWYV